MQRLILLALLVLPLGCNDVTDVSGLWQTPEGTGMRPFHHLAEPFDGTLKLAIDQFGEDVSGIALFYKDDLFYDLGQCLYVQQGEVRGDTLLFQLELPDGRTLLATLAWSREGDEEWLDGTLTEPENEAAGPLTLRLVRIGGDTLIHQEEWDLGCPAP